MSDHSEQVHSAIVDSRWHITLPKSVCEELGIRPGDQLEFTVRGDIAELTPIPNRPPGRAQDDGAPSSD